MRYVAAFGRCRRRKLSFGNGCSDGGHACVKKQRTTLFDRENGNKGQCKSTANNLQQTADAIVFLLILPLQREDRDTGWSRLNGDSINGIRS